MSADNTTFLDQGSKVSQTSRGSLPRSALSALLNPYDTEQFPPGSFLEIWTLDPENISTQTMGSIIAYRFPAEGDENTQDNMISEAKTIALEMQGDQLLDPTTSDWGAKLTADIARGTTIRRAAFAERSEGKDWQYLEHPRFHMGSLDTLITTLNNDESQDIRWVGTEQ